MAAVRPRWNSVDLVCKKSPLLTVKERFHELKDGVSNLGFRWVPCLGNGCEFVPAAQSTARSDCNRHLPGRANVGKSSLLNAVLGRKELLFTSKKAGRTQALNFFRVGPHPGKLIVVDSPGYGSRGRSAWGVVFNHYVTNREELRRIYILFSAPHGLTTTDKAMLAELDAQVQQSGGTRFTLQAIITKADQLGELGRGHIDHMKKGSKFGIELVRKSITDCCGP